MRRFLSIAAALASFALVSEAGAYTITVTPGPADPTYFDSEAIGATNFTLDGVMWSLVGAPKPPPTTGVQIGSVANQWAAPLGMDDTTNYMAVLPGAAEQAVLPTARTSLLIYWGSIDGNVGESNNNIITLNDGVTISGETLASMGLALGNGNQTKGSNNEWVLISGLPAFTTATYSSTGKAFEFSFAVPEPGTWAMLVVGFGGLAYAAFRRSRKDRLGSGTISL